MDCKVNSVKGAKVLKNVLSGDCEIKQNLIFYVIVI